MHIFEGKFYDMLVLRLTRQLVYVVYLNYTGNIPNRTKSHEYLNIHGSEPTTFPQNNVIQCRSYDMEQVPLQNVLAEFSGKTVGAIVCSRMSNVLQWLQWPRKVYGSLQWSVQPLFSTEWIFLNTSTVVASHTPGFLNMMPVNVSGTMSIVFSYN